MTWEHWSDQDIIFLAIAYPAVSNAEIAKALGRTPRAVLNMGRRNGLRKAKDRLRRMGLKNRRKSKGSPT